MMTSTLFFCAFFRHNHEWDVIHQKILIAEVEHSQQETIQIIVISLKSLNVVLRSWEQKTTQ